MYKQAKGGVIDIIRDLFISADPASLDYQEYLAWSESGNVTQAADPVITPLPVSVTMRQARLALLGAGLLPSVTTAIAALPSPQKEAAQIEWEYSQTVERHRPFVLLLGAALGLDSAALDQLFVTAAAL